MIEVWGCKCLLNYLHCFERFLALSCYAHLEGFQTTCRMIITLGYFQREGNAPTLVLIKAYLQYIYIYCLNIGPNKRTLKNIIICSITLQVCVNNSFFMKRCVNDYYRFLRCSPFDELKVWKRQVDNKSSNGQKRLNTLIKSLLLRRTKDQDNKKGEKLVGLRNISLAP